jgi:hypothetical protein
MGMQGKKQLEQDTVVGAPANPVAAVLNTLVMRRRLQGVVDQLLAGLRALAERRQTQPEDLILRTDTPGQGQVRQG